MVVLPLLATLPLSLVAGAFPWLFADLLFVAIGLSAGSLLSVALLSLSGGERYCSTSSSECFVGSEARAEEERLYLLGDVFELEGVSGLRLR